MNMIIKAQKIHIEYNGSDVLNIDELELYSYDRVGLIGDNGAGKSTLLKVLYGAKVAVGGTVHRFGECAYISQLDSIEVETVDDNAFLSRLGVASVQNDTMSGGEETRVKIANALSKQVHCILADEPTCHLDQAGIDLLIGQMKAFHGAMLIISHDRYFMDKVVNKIWELKNGIITEYWGGYSEYLKQKEAETRQQAIAYEQARFEKERIEFAIQERYTQARQMDKKIKGEKKKNANESAGRLGQQKSIGSKQKKMHQAAKSMEKRLAALEEIESPGRSRTIRFRQSKALELNNKFPIIASGLNVKLGERIIFDNVNFAIPLGAKVAITGANGAGKTTLLQMILNHAEGISISPKAQIGYFAQTGYKLAAHQSIINFIQEDCDYNVAEIRAVLASMGIGTSNIQKDLYVLSGGEMIKLLLTKMLLGRYNILLMDEPGNYLDMNSMEALEKMMKQYAGTIIFVSHDKRLVDNVASIVLEVRDRKIVQHSIEPYTAR